MCDAGFRALSQRKPQRGSQQSRPTAQKFTLPRSTSSRAGDDQTYCVAPVLDEVDLDTPEIKKVVEDFMPLSFGLCQDAAARFLAQERRQVYSTPKTFLELIKLYKVLLSTKREATNTNLERLQNGLDKIGRAHV